ncbi:MAG: peptidylprolyl isomerase [Eubacterium sp.]|nr:peptidylprolyl isomerase [Eubacterium sp.]
MKRKITAIILCMTMIFGLTGCGGGEKVEETTSESERAASVNNGTLKADSSVIAVGKTTVTYNEYKTYYYFMKNQYEDLLTKDVWSQNGGTDRSIGQDAVEDVVRLIIQVKVICKAAAVKGVTLAADEKEQADYNAKKYLEGISDEVKQENGMSVPLLTQIFEENKLAEKMYQVETGKVDVNVSEQDAQAAKVQLIYLKATAQDKAQVKQKAEQLCQQLKKLETSFYPVAKENTQAEEIECMVGKMDSRTNLINAVFALKQNAISDVIEETDGYYIAYVLQTPNKETNKSYKNQLIAERQTNAFKDAYKKWSEEYDVKVSKSLLAE